MFVAVVICCLLILTNYCSFWQLMIVMIKCFFFSFHSFYVTVLIIDLDTCGLGLALILGNVVLITSLCETLECFTDS